ncbi:MAG: hypothetical protein ACI4QD_01140 [Kiritimatiellia bacterium]
MKMGLFGVALVCLVVCGCGEREGERGGREEPRAVGGAVSNVVVRKVAPRVPGRGKTVRVPRKLVELAVERALDARDFKGLRSLVEEFGGNEHVEVRMDLIDVLAEAGADGVLMLARMLKDPDRRVAAYAATSLETTVGHVEDGYRKSLIVEDAVLAIEDEGTMVSLLAQLESVAPGDAVRCLVSIWNRREEHPEAAEAALAEYEFITGESFVDVPTAFRWVRENKNR